MGDELSDEQREAAERARIDVAVERRFAAWDMPAGGDACTACGRDLSSATARRVPEYEELVRRGFVSMQRPEGSQLAEPGASTRDRLGYPVYCRQCAYDLARFAVDLEEGRIEPAATARRAREIQGVLVFSAAPVTESGALLQQIIDEHREQGDRIAPSLTGQVVTAGDSLEDQYYHYGALRAAFPELAEGMLERTRKFSFQAPDGNRGYYFLVFDDVVAVFPEELDIADLVKNRDVDGLTKAFSLARDWDTRETVVVALKEVQRQNKDDDEIQDRLRRSIPDVLALSRAETSGGTYRENCIRTAQSLLQDLAAPP